MADLITRQQLEDASRDADDLEKIVNDPAGSPLVTTRLGTLIRPVANVIEDIEAELGALDWTTPDAHGAVGDGVANDYAAIMTALGTGKEVRLRSGKIYAYTTTPQVITSFQRIGGSGRMRPVGGIDALKVTAGAVGVQVSVIVDAPLQTAGWGLNISNGHRTEVERLYVVDGHGALYIEQANTTTVWSLYAGALRGPGIKWKGTTALRSDILIIKSAVVKPAAGEYGFDLDGNCHSLEVNYLGIVGGSGVSAGNGKGFVMRNTAGGANPDPAIVRLNHIEVDYAGGVGIDIQAGSDVEIALGYALGSSASALKTALTINSYEVRVTAGKFRGSGGYGIEALGGPVLYSGNADLSDNALGETFGNVWTRTPRLQLSTNHYLTTVGDNPLWAWEGDSFMAFDVAGNSRNTTIGGTLIEALNATGLSITGVGTFTGYSSAGGGYYVPSGQAIQFDQGVSGNYNVYKTGTSLALTTGGDFLLQSSGGHSVSLRPDGANDVLAQYRGTTAQAFRVYNTRTDASNYERGLFGWVTNVLMVGFENAGTGSQRSVRLVGGNAGNTYIQINSNASSRQIQNVVGGTIIDYYNSSGHRLWEFDNTHDIGASGANRPRHLYLGGNLAIAGTSTFSDTLTIQKNQNAMTQIVVANSTAGTAARTGFTLNSDTGSLVADSFSSLYTSSGGGDDVANGARLYSTGAGGLSLRATHASGTIRFYTGATERLLIGTTGNVLISTATALLQFGGTTSSFPSLKRSGDGLHVRLADDTAYTSVRASLFWLTNGSYINDLADGVISLRNSTGSDFSRLTFGGSSSSFPSLKRSGANLALVRADDSGFTDLIARDLYSQSDTGALYLGASADARLVRDAANTLAQRNGVNAQTFRVYNSYTDGSNYERGSLGWTTNNLDIKTEQAGTGSARSIRIFTVGAASLQFGTNNSINWTISSTGHWLANTDNTYDIGASGANRPRSIFVGTSITTGSHITMGSAAQLSAAGGATLSSPADGIWRMTNNAGTDFSRLQFGGTTSSFPSLKRSGTGIDFRLADDSGLTFIGASSLILNGQATLTADASHILALRSGVNAQFFRVYNTFTDASNSERLSIGWNSNTCFIATENAGTGSTRAMVIRAGNQLSLSGSSGSNEQWAILSNGTLRASAHNTYDLGQTGTRVRTGYFGTSVDTPLITLAAGTLTASAPGYNLTQTWNNGAVAFTAQLVNITDTASSSSSLLVDWQVGGVSRFRIFKDGALDCSSAGAIHTIAGTFRVGTLQIGGSDLVLNRDAANTLAQRNGVNAQIFRVYNTYTDGSNYERLGVGYQNAAFEIVAAKAGTGASRNIRLGTDGAASVLFSTQGSDRWFINSSGHFLTPADNTYDIGASGANRARNGYFGTSVVSPQFTIDGAFYLKLDAGNPQFVLDANDYFAYNRTTDVFLMVIGGASRLNITTTMVEATVPVKLPRYTVATLPAAASSTDMHALVTDALTPAWRATVAGGGAELVMVRSNGTNWIVVG